MKTLLKKCVESNTVSSFCSCIAGEETVDPAAQGFCSRAKTGNQVTGEELGELKKALLDLEEDACCEC